MRIHRLLLVAVSALFGATLANADTIPGHFIVDLNDVPNIDSGGWQGSTFTDSVNQSGVTSNDPDFNSGTFFCFTPGCEEDPSIRINLGGNSLPFPSPFGADENGGGVFSFFNPGPGPITNILFVTNLITGVTYNCNGGPIFSICGFEAKPDGSLLILFEQGTGTGIPVASEVPEPAQALPVLLAFAGIAALRRKRSASAVA